MSVVCSNRINIALQTSRLFVKERMIAKLDAATPGADANLDSNINAVDITKIERIIVGLD